MDAFIVSQEKKRPTVWSLMKRFVSPGFIAFADMSDVGIVITLLGNGSVCWLVCFSLICGLCHDLFGLPLSVIGKLWSFNYSCTSSILFSVGLKAGLTAGCSFSPYRSVPSRIISSCSQVKEK